MHPVHFYLNRPAEESSCVLTINFTRLALITLDEKENSSFTLKHVYMGWTGYGCVC